MKQFSPILYLIVIALSSLLWSCSATKTVPDGDRLYLGAKIKWEGHKQKDQSTLTDGLQARLRPKPNSRILGIPLRLELYNLAKPPKGKGLNYLLRKKWGEPPVLFSKVKPDYSEKVLQSYLQDNGFFQTAVSYQADSVGHKKEKLEYTVTPNIRYTIDSVKFRLDSTAVGKQIAKTIKRSLLHPGDFYNLDKIKLERERIANDLKEQGYYYFLPDHLIILVDSTHQGKVKLYVQVKDTIPYQATYPYVMRNIKLYPDYNLNNDSVMHQAPAITYNNWLITDPKHLFKPQVFNQIVFLHKDSLYRLRYHEITLSRLVNMGTFKFVRGQFHPVKDSALLDASFYLTPYPKHALEVDLSGNSKSNNYVGSELSASAKNRNWLKEANLLQVNLSGGTEVQVGGNQIASSNDNFNAGVSVSLPRFYTPFVDFSVQSTDVPRTQISTNYQLLINPGEYNLNGYTFQYGYVWKQNTWLQYELNPVAISYVKPYIYPGFDTVLAIDPAQRDALQKQFILGSNFTLTFNNQTAPHLHTFYASGNVDISGNLGGLIIPRSPGGDKTLFHTSFAQYIRLSLDLRDYWHVRKNTQWVNRIFAGYGYSYGNSYSMPFVKQFFIGGSNSLRGFRARTLGPGTYQTNASRYLADEAGDIKLEMNTELRGKLFSIVNGAIFMDAGNIWLQRQDTSKPGSRFYWHSFLSQTAVDAGVGLRFDLSILLLRFDLAFPLRIPSLPAGQRWVINDINFGDPAWRKNNLVLNIAIGYPF